ncbi:MAG: DUF1328 domain-containing protein [Bacteriovoracia bacterium]
MLRASIFFFIIGLVAYFIGANNIAGLSVEIGRVMLKIFVVLAAVSLALSFITGRRPKISP